ncbi:MAG TPA: SIS domain-containing protein [Acidimicrobiales bacterium]|nr:SIS domain-containing protein [Acidimicrobiales bacterium]
MSGRPNLDTPDSLGIWEATTALPEQLSWSLRVAGEAFEGVTPPAAGALRAVAAFGLGTGGLAGAATAALAAPDLALPMWVGHGSALPPFVGPGTLVLAVSSSGGTAETLLAAEKAVARGATVVAVGGEAGGALERLAADAGLPWCPVAPGGPAARSALGATTVPLLVALAWAGLRSDPAAAVERTAAAVARRRDRFVAPGGAPEELAHRLGRTIPLVYGSAGATAVAAQWWKAQVNLNAKAPAFAAALPELTHDELAGWGQSGDVTRQTMSLVLLRHAGEAPRTAGQFDAVRAATDEVMADIFEVQGEGRDDLTRFFDLALMGTLVSLHLAAREGVDPGPVPAVDAAQGVPAPALD